MSIGYNNMYNITAGIFTAFNSTKTKKRLLSVKHSRTKIENTELIFPMKYNTETKENFVIYNLYINFKESPSSLYTAISKLSELDKKKALTFKNEIVNYNKFLKDDIDKVRTKESNIDVPLMLKLYKNNEIKWYTFYFYIQALDDSEEVISNLYNSRINSRIIRKIDTLLLYVSFSDKSKLAINSLIKNNIKIEF